MSEKHSKVFLQFLLVLFALALLGWAAEEKTPPAKEPAKAAAQAPKGIAPSSELQLKLHSATFAIDDLAKKMAALQNEFNNMQNRATQINQEFGQLKEQLATAQKEKEKIVDEAAKAAGVDRTKNDFDDRSLTFIPKAVPAPPTPSPEKK